MTADITQRQRKHALCSTLHSWIRTTSGKNIAPTSKGLLAGGLEVRSVLARAQEVKIGNVVVRDLVIRPSTQKQGLTTSNAMAGLIGPDVLPQFDVIFDYSHSRM